VYTLAPAPLHMEVWCMFRLQIFGLYAGHKEDKGWNHRNVTDFCIRITEK